MDPEEKGSPRPHNAMYAFSGAPSDAFWRRGVYGNPAFGTEPGPYAGPGRPRPSLSMRVL